MAVRRTKAIGWGHVKRSQALALLFEKHFKVFFWAPPADRVSGDLDQRWPFVRGRSLKDAVEKAGADAVLCDCPDQEFSFYRRPAGVFMGALDHGRVDNPHLDIVLNLHPRNFYKLNLRRKRCRVESGYRFAILRDEFFSARRRYRLRKEVNRVFVCMGGCDDRHYTIPVVDFLKSVLSARQRADIIVGPYNSDFKKIQNLVGRDGRFVVQRAVPDIQKYMARADLAFSSGGGTLIELGFLGVPTLALPTSKWETILVGDMEKAGFCLEFTFRDRTQALEKWHAAQKILWRQRSFSAGRKVFDGLGKQRLVNAFFKEFRCSLKKRIN